MVKFLEFTHTYSIIAIDRNEGLIGGAVQSHYFSVGSVVLWGEPGTGMVATQSLVNPAFGPEGLALLRQGQTPDEVKVTLRKSDPGIDYRQFGILDVRGRTASFTGDKCIPFASHVRGDGYSAQANMMLYEGVPEAMAEAFVSSSEREEKNESGRMKREARQATEHDQIGNGKNKVFGTHDTDTFADRLIHALEAAQSTGGDIRGKQSAHLFILPIEKPRGSWKERKIDLRVEDHPEPVKELKRFLCIKKAYDHHNAGDEALEKGDLTTALTEYEKAESIYPEQIEFVYWHAVSLANAGRIDEARALFSKAYTADLNWRELTKRLKGTGLINFDPDDVN